MILLGGGREGPWPRGLPAVPPLGNWGLLPKGLGSFRKREGLGLREWILNARPRLGCGSAQCFPTGSAHHGWPRQLPGKAAGAPFCSSEMPRMVSCGARGGAETPSVSQCKGGAGGGVQGLSPATSGFFSLCRPPSPLRVCVP